MYQIKLAIKNRPDSSERFKLRLRSYFFRFFPFMNESIRGQTLFSATVTAKLTTAPKAARTTVLIISDECIFTTTVKTVPETVPRIVLLSMVCAADILIFLN